VTVANRGRARHRLEQPIAVVFALFRLILARCGLGAGGVGGRRRSGQVQRDERRVHFENSPQPRVGEKTLVDFDVTHRRLGRYGRLP
jgi:hypothetical protein